MADLKSQERSRVSQQRQQQGGAANSSSSSGMMNPQPAIVIDPAVKDAMYGLVEAQRHSHELAVTQLMVALEDTHRECRFLRQQLTTSNEMLQDSQLQLRRAVDDKEVLLDRLQEKESESRLLKQENDELKKRVEEDMRELTEVREMVKVAMEETYKSRAFVGRGRSSESAGSKHNSPSRAMLEQSAFSSSYQPVSHNGMKAALQFATVSPPRVRGDTSASEAGELQLAARRFDSPVQMSVNRSSAGDMTVHAQRPSAPTPAAVAGHQHQPQQNQPVQASVPRHLVGANAHQSPVSIQFAGQVAERNKAQQHGDRSSSSSSSSPLSFRPITVDMNTSRGVSVSAQGHVCISVAEDGAPTLCMYRDLRTVGPLHFEASFRSSNPDSVMIGIGAIRPDAIGAAASSSSSGSGSSGAPVLGARCGIRGDGTMVLMNENGEVFEARSGLQVHRDGQGVVTLRMDDLTSKVIFSMGGDINNSVPLQVSRAIVGVPTGCLVPFVSLPTSGDEVVVRAPLRASS